MRRWRPLMAAVMVLMMPAVSALADHGPVFDVTCPTGTAQVVIDPGHGGPDPGAVNEKYGLQEAVLNLQIAERVAEVLRETHGYTVALTRVDNATELGNSERGEIADACQALVFVEVHLNASTDRSANYSQAFWSEKEKDFALSLVMNEALASLGIPVQDVDRFDNGGLLRAKMPAVLVESVFLSNDTEAALLVEGSRQEEISQAIAEGVAMWLELREA